MKNVRPAKYDDLYLKSPSKKADKTSKTDISQHRERRMPNHLINSREFLDLDPDRFHLFSAQYPNVTCVIFLQLCCWCLRFNLFFRAHKHILTMLKIIVNMLNALCIFLFALSPLASSDFPYSEMFPCRGPRGLMIWLGG